MVYNNECLQKWLFLWLSGREKCSTTFYRKIKRREFAKEEMQEYSLFCPIQSRLAAKSCLEVNER